MYVTEHRRTFLRAAELLGAEPNTSTITGLDLDGDHFVTVFQSYLHNAKTVKLTLVKDFRPVTGSSADNYIEAQETIKVGASDRVIQNRINKLLAVHASKH